MTQDEQVALRGEVAALRTEVEHLTEQVSGLVEAWNTATGVVKFIKWLAGVATAVGVVVTAFKGGFGHQ